jgi:hypothetical protein
MSNTDANCSVYRRFSGEDALAGLGRNQNPQPNWPARKKVETIEASVDPQRRRKPPRAACKIEKLLAPSVALHNLDPFKRLECANKHAAANAGSFAGNIQHKVHAVVEIDIHMPVPQKK